MFCPHCGAQIADNARFCTNCGKSVVSMDQNAGAASDASVSVTPAHSSQQSQSMSGVQKPAPSPAAALATDKLGKKKLAVVIAAVVVLLALIAASGLYWYKHRRATVAETAVVDFTVSLDDNWSSSSTPVLAHITGNSQTGAFDTYKAIYPSAGEESSVSLRIPDGKYTVEYISPLNADGSMYDVPQAVSFNVKAAQYDQKDASNKGRHISVKPDNPTFTFIPSQNVKKDDAQKVVSALKAATEQADSGVKPRDVTASDKALEIVKENTAIREVKQKIISRDNTSICGVVRFLRNESDMNKYGIKGEERPGRDKGFPYVILLSDEPIQFVPDPKIYPESGQYVTGVIELTGLHSASGIQGKTASDWEKYEDKRVVLDAGKNDVLFPQGDYPYYFNLTLGRETVAYASREKVKSSGELASVSLPSGTFDKVIINQHDNVPVRITLDGSHLVRADRQSTVKYTLEEKSETSTDMWREYLLHGSGEHDGSILIYFPQTKEAVLGVASGEYYKLS